MMEAVPGYLKQLKKMKECEKKLAEEEEKGRKGDCQHKYIDIVEKIREIKPDTLYDFIMKK